MPSNIPKPYKPPILPYQPTPIGDNTTMNKDAIVGALKSKTMWLNGLVVVGSGVTWALDHWSVITLFAPGLLPYAALLGGVNMVLRAITSQSLSDKVS